MSETAVAAVRLRARRACATREADRGGLREVVEERAAVAVAVAVGDLDDEAPSRVATSSGASRCDVIRCVSTALRQGVQAGLEVVLPERRAPLHERIAAPDVVDEHVEAARARSRAVAQRVDLGGCSVWSQRMRDAARRRRPSTSSAVSSIVSARSSSERPAAVERPVT